MCAYIYIYISVPKSSLSPPDGLLRDDSQYPWALLVIMMIIIVIIVILVIAVIVIMMKSIGLSCDYSFIQVLSYTRLGAARSLPLPLIFLSALLFLSPPLFLSLPLPLCASEYTST